LVGTDVRLATAELLKPPQYRNTNCNPGRTSSLLLEIFRYCLSNWEDGAGTIILIVLGLWDLTAAGTDKPAVVAVSATHVKCLSLNFIPFTTILLTP